MRYPSISARLRRRGGAVLLAGALVAGLAACDSAPAEPPVQSGGTLRVVLPYMPSHLDPQRIGEVIDANISRLLTRTLTTFKSSPGAEGSELAPDLATDLGRPSDGNRVWTFRLKEGVKWQDGTAINCQQLKYGAERNFSTLFTGGLPYARLYLADNEEHYQGPFVDGNNDGAGLESVACVDQRTITFTLSQPIGDFNYAVAQPIFAPVKPGADGDKAAYDKTPLSTGPYRISSREDRDDGQTGEMALVRNEYWDRATDQTRPAYPDKIVFVADNDAPAVTNALIQDQGEDRNTILLAQDVPANFVQQVINDPVLAARTAMGPMGAVRYFAIDTNVVSDVRCRQALVYAFNKRKYRQAMGGSVLGDLATSMIPPNLAAHKEFDVYGTVANPDGDPDQAQALIDEAAADGVTCPQKIDIAYPNNPQIERFVKTTIDAYIRIGVQVVLHPIDPTGDAGYFDIVSDPSGGPYHLRYAGWLPDWANGSAVIPPLFEGRNVSEPGEMGGYNYSFLKDADIDRGIAEAMAESRQDLQWKLWGDLDSKLQEMAATIPVLYTNAIRISGSNVAGSYIHAQFGQPDLCSLGLADPAVGEPGPSAG